MSTVDIKHPRFLRADVIAATAFAAFGAIYEHFGHGVYSYFMLYAFMVPLVLGVIPLLFFKKRFPDRALGLWHCMIGTLTVGSIFQGVLEIYGTTNRMIMVYPVAAGALAVCAIVSGIIHRNDAADGEIVSL